MAVLLASGLGAGGDDTTAPVATAPSTEVVLPPPVGLDVLAPGLLSSVAAGVPDSWFPLDLDPAVVDDPDLAGDVDPFRGLLTCPPGIVRDDAAPWIARRFSSLDAPLDNGLLSLETMMELESAADFAADMARLADCTVGPEATLVLSTAVVPVEIGDVAREIDGFSALISSDPTDAVPFPTVHHAVWAHDAGFTVMVVFGGEPSSVDWAEGAAALAGVVLAALQQPPGDAPPAPA